MTFESPIALILLISIPIILYLKFKTRFFKESHLQVSDIKIAQKAQKNKKLNFLNIPFYLMLVILSLLIISLSRPQREYKRASHSIEGIEIILTVDTSISMWFLDDEIGAMKRVIRETRNGGFQFVYQDSSKKLKRRIDIAKKVISSFIEKRKTDKIGLVTFKKRGLTLSPPTMNHDYVYKLVNNLNLSMISGEGVDGTAIGDALGSSINALKYSKSKNKIIILITDGNDNQESTGSDTVMTQLNGAQYAAKNNIKVYTIGMGGSGKVFAPITPPNDLRYSDIENGIYFREWDGEQINESPLQEISRITGGRFYRANNESQLERIYADIDKLEKSEFKEQFYIVKVEIFQYFLYSALFLFLIYLLLKYIFFRVLP